MSDAIRLLLSNELKTLEPGAFQDFCLNFLPKFSSRYQGLERHGGTAGGRSRPGTPDLIKTDQLGNQIAVQCSVEEEYWTRPKNINRWKPYLDAMKCKKKLSQLIEIVLCSNQEVPTNRPDTKSELIRLLRSKTSANIVLFSVSNFEEELLNRYHEFAQVISLFLQRTSRIFLEQKERESALIALKLYDNVSAPMEMLSRMASEAVSRSGIGNVDLDAITLEAVASVNSRFQREIPKLQGVRRKQNWDYLGGEPFGRIIAVKGVPKVGKTSWVSQLCTDHLKSTDEVVWLDTPDPLDEGEFRAEFFRIFLSKITNINIANDFSNRRLSELELSSRLLESKLTHRLLFVLDEAGSLGKDICRSIARFLTIVERSTGFLNLGVLFITNKSLRSISCINEEYTAPKWSASEFEELLNVNAIKVEDSMQEYSELLLSISGGHPLIALALAKKAKSRNRLLAQAINTVPELSDDDLTAEVKNLLLNDLLVGDGQKEFVFRHSILIHRFDEDQMEVVAKRVNPPLGISTIGMIEELEGTVLEGAPSVGYQIAPVFKAVARNYVSRATRDEIYKEICDYLLSPKEKAININNILNGIFYGLLLKRYISVFSWASMLVHKALEDKIKPTQLEVLLERLSIVEAANPPERPDDLSYWMMAKITIARAYFIVKNLKRANKNLSQLFELPVPTRETSGLPISLQGLQNLARLQFIYNSASPDCYHDAIKVLNEFTIEGLPAISEIFAFRLDMAHLASSLIRLNKTNDFPKNFLLRFAHDIRANNYKGLKVLADCFLQLGVVAGEDKNTDIEELSTSISTGSTEPVWPLLVRLTRAQYLLEIGDWNGSAKESQWIIKETERSDLSSNGFLAVIYQVLGDALYRGGKYPEALSTYVMAKGYLSEEEGVDFDHAWCNFRIGMSSDNLEEAEKYLEQASQAFADSHLFFRRAIAEGEKAVVHYLLGSRDKALATILRLTKEYYEEEKAENGSAVAIGMSMVTRLFSELTGTPLVETEQSIHPSFQRRIFTRVAEDLMPDPDYRLALFILSKAFGAINEKKEQICLLEQSFQAKPRTALGEESEIIIASELISRLTIMEEYQKAADIAVQILTSSCVSENGLKAWSSFVVNANTNLVVSGEMSREAFVRLLGSIEEQLSQLQERERNWCLTEIYYGRSGIDNMTPDNEFDVYGLKKAWRYAQSGENFEKMISITHKLGFEFATFATSFHELIEIQLSLIFAICRCEDAERLQTVGDNLLKLWSALNWRRIAESELKYLRNLHDRANDLINRNISKELAIPLMVLFLLTVRKVSNEPDYEPAVRWARSKLKKNKSQIPKEHLEYVMR